MILLDETTVLILGDRGIFTLQDIITNNIITLHQDESFASYGTLLVSPNGKFVFATNDRGEILILSPTSQFQVFFISN